MLYREMGKTGEKISILGYGCMRFPQKLGKIDENQTERQIVRAIERGVNYFDTAFVYNSGASESVLGNVLSKGHRHRVKIATKLPPYMVNSRNDLDRILETQLRRLKTDYIDFYLIHSLMKTDEWHRLKSLGVMEFLQKARSCGKIKHIGFSYHGDAVQFKEIVDDYPWDFCQIQYNYLDEHYQAGKEGLEYASSKGLGVSVMEPLRGGYLAKKMPSEIQDIWERSGIIRTPAQWAMRWVWNHSCVTTVLSGMNIDYQIDENIRTADEGYPLSLGDHELKVIKDVKEAFGKRMKVPCTQCGYCKPCPAGINIPMCFDYYNKRHIFNERAGKYKYILLTSGILGGKPAYASQCTMCGKCEKACPQHISIRKQLKDVSSDMEVGLLKPLASGVNRCLKILRT